MIDLLTVIFILSLAFWMFKKNSDRENLVELKPIDSNENSLIVVCTDCSKKLRVPKNRGKLKVTCICKLRYLVNTGSKLYRKLKEKKLKYRKNHSHIIRMVKKLNKAQNNIYIDPWTSLMQIRSFGEDLVDGILVCENMRLYTKTKQIDKLKILENKNILNRDLLNRLHSIRIIGNKAVHDTYDSKADAERLLLASKQLYSWFESKYIIR